jgi:hypothetical protein
MTKSILLVVSDLKPLDASPPHTIVGLEPESRCNLPKFKSAWFDETVPTLVASGITVNPSNRAN